MGGAPMDKTKNISILLIILLALAVPSISAASVEATYSEELDTTIYNSVHFGIRNIYNVGQADGAGFQFEDGER